MRGVVAAGHPLSAKAGADILEAGGNAFDAAAAAAFCACVCEPTLTGLGGAGFATLHVADKAQNICLDFFASVPGKDLAHPVTELQEVEIIYSLAPQLYSIGPASAAVPGFAAGILAMQERYGILARKEIMLPAISAAKEGFEITDLTAYNLAFVEKIIYNTQKGRALFFDEKGILGPGKHLTQTQLASTLQEISDNGHKGFYEGDIAREIAMWSKDNGGLITRKDLAEYEVNHVDPIISSLNGSKVLCPPPPSSGGILTAFAFTLWDKISQTSFSSPEGIDLYLRIMQRANQLRGREFDHLLYTNGLVDKVMTFDTIEKARRHVMDMDRKSPMTTQLSVIDEDGNVVSITTSTGVGSGEFARDTGIQMSNMLGESDLFPTDYKLTPGQRLTSMMSPSIVFEGEKPFLATGSAGSTRIRSAIFQTTLRALEYISKSPLDEAVEKAVQESRIHQEGEVVHLEKGVPDEMATFLEKKGHLVKKWDEMHLYFGGVNMAAYKDGKFAGSGDIRRGAEAVIAQ